MLPSQIMPQAVTAWGQYDEMYDFFLPLLTLEWPVSPRGDFLESFRGRILGACEDYTISCRQRMLLDKWDVEYQGIENVPASATERYNIPTDRLVMLNEVGNLHKLPRLWWHLYSLAHVSNELHKPNPLFELNQLVDRAHSAQ